MGLGLDASPRSIVRAPRWPSTGAVLLGIIAIACAVAGFVMKMPYSLGIPGYVLGCIGSVALASVHRALEYKERSNPRFRLEPRLALTARIGMLVGIAGGLACAFLIATELAK